MPLTTWKKVRYGSEGSTRIGSDTRLEAKLSSYCLEREYEVLGLLGRGYEGTVLSVRHMSSSVPFILKVFHKPLQGATFEGLRQYARSVTGNPTGLFPVELITHEDTIIALRYPSRGLIDVHHRMLLGFESAAKELFRAFLQIQAYLLSQHQLALVDAVVSQFMLSWDGRYHYVDYGAGVQPARQWWWMERGALPYSFAMLLASIYGVNIKFDSARVPGYSYDRPCPYCASEPLRLIAAEHEWLADILSEIATQNSSVFLESEFYTELAATIDAQESIPGLAFRTNVLLNRVRGLRQCVAGVFRKAPESEAQVDRS